MYEMSAISVSFLGPRRGRRRRRIKGAEAWGGMKRTWVVGGW